ncbi:MAG: META domain-containing protein [Nitriliruptorales bacterium]|nr:META domain-containing protein [Nitriliruptorales bacterium]
MRRTTILVALPLALMLGACGQDPDAAGGGSGGGADYDGEWRLVEGRGPSGRIPVPSKVTLTIQGRTISGVSACNHYSGTATIDGTSFAATDVGGTEMGCPGRRATAETRYHEALLATHSIERAGDTLLLGGEGVDLEFAPVPPPEPATLENTQWHLDGLILGRGQDGSVMSNDPATLTLHRDGTLTGSTGCRTITGRWGQAAGERYTTSDLAPQGELRCDEHVHGQDDHVLAVLGGQFTAQVDVTQLTLFQADGELGLTYSAD